MSNEATFKPHMRQRPGESVEQWRDRLAHSCYRCGWYEPHTAVLDTHEQTCDGAPQKGQRS
ncbi:hypothetical protein DFQ14_101281 [Halopolyspora algeriensis]|uniref:Uncharacterized protein n=1 Tax=Halopolyspora algeriensis TaxID=1500506 RepID=A0A368VYA6_9ACTN|nr:hypothetical protein [Halopolyspora algeriensis]RCW46941.1 hypothetical protein DFQ14_101281 [Halopolyspora algeriensis]TQM48032.1 hypothetical protein FHU43_2984 [Halopolyspora algeriensis]